MSTTPTSPRNGSRKAMWTVLVLLVAGGAAVAAIVFKPSVNPDAIVTEDELFAAKRGPLTISVVETGSIRSKQAVTISCEVEGSTTILSIAPEGKEVKQGDLIVELDASKMEDLKIEQEIRVQSAESDFVQARENVEITNQQGEADVSEATLQLRFAKEDVTKYIEGEYPLQLNNLQSDIKIAEANLENAQQKLTWSEQLYKEGYITETELRADQISHQQAALKLEEAKGNLDLLQNFTHKRRLDELQEQVKQKEFELRKVDVRARGNNIEAEARLASRESMLKREKEKLDKYIKQIDKCKIYAPVGGMVVYATSVGEGRGRSFSTGQEPLMDGSTVRERQELIKLPTTSEMLADIKIHESVLEKVRVGLPVRLTTEALPGRVFAGRLTKIAVMADSQSMFMNPDLKVYNSEIEIEGDMADLRPGMSCRAEVIVDHYDDAIYVPVQAVLQVNGKPTVYLPGPTGPVPRQVKVGLDNTRMIRVFEGLAEGEKVLLAPPLPPSSLKESAIADADKDELESLKNQIRSAEEQSPKASDAARGEGGEGRGAGAPGRGEGRGGPGGEGRGSRGGGSGFLDNLPPEIRERVQNMSPEERREFFQSEEGQQYRPQRSGRPGGGGGEGRGGGRPGGGGRPNGGGGQDTPGGQE